MVSKEDLKAYYRGAHMEFLGFLLGLTVGIGLNWMISRSNFAQEAFYKRLPLRMIAFYTPI